MKYKVKSNLNIATAGLGIIGCGFLIFCTLGIAAPFVVIFYAKKLIDSIEIEKMG